MARIRPVPRVSLVTAFVLVDAQSAGSRRDCSSDGGNGGGCGRHVACRARPRRDGVWRLGPVIMYTTMYVGAGPHSGG
jgi:hypothetical protein